LVKKIGGNFIEESGKVSKENQEKVTEKNSKNPTSFQTRLSKKDIV
jgi:hypothetical protein